MTPAIVPTPPRTFTVPEGSPISVVFTTVALNGAKPPEPVNITRSFVLPPNTVRVLAQHCLDTGRVLDGQPDVLGLLIENILGSDSTTSFIETIEDRYRDYPNALTAGEEAAKVKAQQAVEAKLAARVARRALFDIKEDKAAAVSGTQLKGAK